MKIFLVIPAYNEDNRVQSVVRAARDYIDQSQIVLVDDGSKKPVNIPSVVILRHQINLGKGAAMKTGAEYAFAHRADAVIFMDADGQHNPADLPIFINHLQEGYDLVFGSRRPDIKTPLVRLLGNKLASIYINLLFGIYVSDILSGFRAVSKKAYRFLKWSSPRYGVETEIVARLGLHKNKLRYIEFPIESVYIDKYKGVTLIHALEILGHTLWWKLYWAFKFWQ